MEEIVKTLKERDAIRGGAWRDIFSPKKIINEFVNPASKLRQTVGKVTNEFINPNSLARRRVADVSRGVRSDYPPSSRKTIEKYGDWKIETLALRRDPIQSTIHAALQFLTLGQWNNARESENKDKLFHLGLILGLIGPNGQKTSVLVEKNEVINIGMPKPTVAGTEMGHSAAPSGMTLRAFLDNGLKRAGPERFFKYDAFQNNCQDFILLLLRANDVASPPAEAFIKQDTGGLLNKLPGWTAAAAKAITDLGGIANVAVEGGKKSEPISIDLMSGSEKPNKWIQDVVAHMKTGAFKAQSARVGKTPKTYAKDVLAHPGKHTLKTRRRAQFVENVSGGMMPSTSARVSLPTHSVSSTTSMRDVYHILNEWTKLDDDNLKIQLRAAFRNGLPINVVHSEQLRILSFLNDEFQRASGGQPLGNLPHLLSSPRAGLAAHWRRIFNTWVGDIASRNPSLPSIA